jgi:hypothetical protein
VSSVSTERGAAMAVRDLRALIAERRLGTPLKLVWKVELVTMPYLEDRHMPFVGLLIKEYLCGSDARNHLFYACHFEISVSGYETQWDMLIAHGTLSGFSAFSYSFDQRSDGINGNGTYVS